MPVKYLEVVTPDVDATCAMYAQVYGLTFGEQVPAMGLARTATHADGTVFSIRAPLAEHDVTIVRTYVAVDDIRAALAAASANGAMIAYGPVVQGDHGSFAIVIQDGVQHGFWQG